MMDFFSLELKASIYTNKQPIPAMIYQMGVPEVHKINCGPLIIIATSSEVYQSYVNRSVNSTENAHCKLTLLNS